MGRDDWSGGGGGVIECSEIYLLDMNAVLSFVTESYIKRCHQKYKNMYLFLHSKHRITRRV